MKTSLLWILLLVYMLDLNKVTAKANCPKPKLKYGRANVRSRGRVVRYRCRRRWSLYGSKMAVCVSGKWSHKPPVCIVDRCKDVFPNPDVIISKDMGGALLRFSCKPGLTMKGASEIYCQGKKWNDVVPSCFYREPKKTCDFEKDDLCGWIQDKSDTTSFDWIQHSGNTPTAQTGPDQDHTYPNTSDGHYMYIEASSPRRKGHFARFLSPFYKPISDGYCFDFWYHMKGPSGRSRVGSLDVFVRGSNQSFDDILVPEFSKSGNQGNSWQRGKFDLGEQTDMFQIVIVGTRGSSYLSDISIDDVRIYNCSHNNEIQTTAVESTTAKVSSPFIISTTVTVNGLSTADQSNPDKTSSVIEPSTVQSKQRLTTPSVMSTEILTKSEDHSILRSTIKWNDFSNDGNTVSVLEPETASSVDTDQTSSQIFLELSTAETTEFSLPPGLTKESTATTADELTKDITKGSKNMTTILTINGFKPLTTLSTTDGSKSLTTVSTTNGSNPLTTLSTTNGSKPLPTSSTTNGSKTLTTSSTINDTSSAPLTTLFSKTILTLNTTILSKQNISTEDTLSQFTTAMLHPKTSSPQVSTTLQTTNATTEQTTSRTSAMSSITVMSTTLHITKPPTSTNPKRTTKPILTTKWTNPSDIPVTTYISQTSSKATEVSSLSNLSTTKRKQTSIPTSVYTTRSTFRSSFQHSSTSSTLLTSASQHSSIMTTAKTKSTTISSTKTENDVNEIPDGKRQNNNITKSDSNINNISTTELPNIIRIGHQKTNTNVLVQPLIIGLGVGVAIGLIIVLVGIFFWIRRKRRKEAEFEDEMTPITKSSSHEW